MKEKIDEKRILKIYKEANDDSEMQGVYEWKNTWRFFEVDWGKPEKLTLLIYTIYKPIKDGYALEQAVISFADTYIAKKKVNDSKGQKYHLIKRMGKGADWICDGIKEWEGVVRHFTIDYDPDCDIKLILSHSEGFDEKALKKALEKFTETYIKEMIEVEQYFSDDKIGG